MAVKLYRCSTMWIKGPHPCWKVQKALDDAGIEYELVKGPVRRSKRTEYEQLTGNEAVPGDRARGRDRDQEGFEGADRDDQLRVRSAAPSGSSARLEIPASGLFSDS